MGQALYRKYRSKKLSEIVGQDHITRTLQNALKSGKISHAYLFTGPRGVGKTSIARILAHEINQLPYTDESMHLDIIEIDAASNRRIDEIRDLREKVHIAPTSAKYKVYIIDEVHMLTKEAFNALLKTLEEPPAHVVFILATTEIHKLPETIVSRTQRFTFKSIDEGEAVKHLREIAESEGMQVDDEALALLAVHGRGSFRDSISLLDQVGNSKKTITRADAEKLVGIAASEHIETMLRAIRTGTPADVLTGIQSLVDDGISAGQAAKQLAAELRAMILSNDATGSDIRLLEDLLAVSSSPEPAAQLEVALLRAHFSLNPHEQPTTSPAPVTVVRASPKPAVKKPAVKEAVVENKAAPAPVTELSTPQNPGASADWWNDVLVHIKQVNNTLYGVLRMAEATVDDGTLHLKFGFGFHKKKAADTVTQAKIQEAVRKVTGKDYVINPIHDKSLGSSPRVTAAVAESKPEPTENGQDLSSITNIFGGGEVLES